MWFTEVTKLRSILYALACVAVIASTGCRMIPSLCCADPSAPLPNDFNGVTTPESSAQTGIIEFFDDPVLTQLIVQGLVQNQELKIQNQDIRIASNAIRSARGAFLPFLSLSARGGFERNSAYTVPGAAERELTFPGGKNFPDPVPDVRLAADYWWQLDIWHQLRDARDAAVQRYYESIERRNYTITRLVAETADNYFELAALDKRLAYLNQTIELQQKSLQVARDQKAAARGTELGVQRFLAEVRRNESQRLIVKQRIVEIENQINVRVGRFPQQVERGSWDFITLDSRILNVGVPPALLINRRDIQAAEREIAALGLDVQVARKNFFPRLVLTGSVGYEAFDPKYLFNPQSFLANSFGELVQPLINRQAIQAEYMNANARQLQAIYDYQRTVLTAFAEVVNNMAAVKNYRGSVAIKQEQVKALESSVDVATSLFIGARPEVEYIDVLFAQRDLLEARTNLVETKQQQLSAIVNAYRALGGGLLVTNGGPEFGDLFCQPLNYPVNESLPPTAPTTDEEKPDAPGPEALPAPQVPAPQTPDYNR